MRTLTASLESVQAVRSPRAGVTCTVTARGLAPGIPAVDWTELHGNSAQVTFLPTALIGLANSTLLRFKAAAGNIQMQTISSPTTAAGWTSPAWTNKIAVTAEDLYAVRGDGADVAIIRLFYIDAGNVYYRESTDAGATWAAAVTVYSGGDAACDLCAAYIEHGTIANGPWFVGFSTYNGGTGAYTPRFGYYAAGSWTTHAYDANWRAAGIAAYGVEAGYHTCLVFRQIDYGISRLRTVRKEGATYAVPLDVDATPAGNFGLRITWARLHNLPGLNAMLWTTAESGKGSGLYTGIGHAWYTAVETLTDEPVIFPELKTSNVQAHSAIAELDGSLYWANETFVYRGVPQTATGTTLYPISYTYDDGQIDLVFEPDIPALYPGQLLTVRRTLTWGTDTGYEDIATLIARVETATDGVKVTAYDPLGWLGVMHCRRTSILASSGSSNLAAVIRRLCARVGVPVTIDNPALDSAAVLPFTLSANENLRSAFYRCASQSNAWLVPANDGSWALTAIDPPTSTSGDYDDTPRALPTGQSVIHHGSTISDLRRLGFSLVLGTYGPDPADGAALGMAAGPSMANTRPLSNTYTNYRYNTSARVTAAASAEATRQQRIPITATVSLNADLALELHDLVSLTLAELSWSSTQFRIRRIRERWDRGRLTQTLFLGPTT